jgi:DNA-binding SARP family transcriptional activator
MFRLRLLGYWDLSCNGRPVEVPTGAKRLLALLALAGRRDRPCVAGRLWPENPESQAFGNLRAVLWRLRHGTPGVPAPVDILGDSLLLRDDVAVDVHQLTICAADVLGRPERAVGEAVLPLFKSGDLLPGWCDDWLFFERERLRQLRVHVLEEIADRWLGQGRYLAALDAALSAVEVEPFRESAHRAAIRVHLAEGNVSEAVRQYRYFRDLIHQELRAKPTEQMTALIRPVLDMERRACNRSLSPLAAGSG